MKILSIIVGLLGLLMLVYGLSLPAIIAGQYLMIGVVMFGGGIGLYLYSKKNKWTL